MKGFRHFIITRFNLPLYKKDKNDLPTRTSDWLEARFEIFERYCLPSICAQLNRNFLWLVLFDQDTPEPYLTRIESYRERCSMLRPVFYNAAQTDSLSESLRETITSLVNGKPQFILTTNLDNDDGLSRVFVKRLQARLKPCAEARAYSFPRGCQYFTEMKYALGLRLDNNHFLSMLEPYGGNFETIVAFRHARVDKHFDTTYIRAGKPMWLEVIHQSNVSNDLRIYNKAKNILILRRRTFRDFGVPLIVTMRRQVGISLFVLPLKYLKTGIHRLATKSRRRKDSNSVRCTTEDTM